MALNVPTQADGSPVLMLGELVVAHFDCEFEVESGGGFPGLCGSHYFRAGTSAHLSNFRILISQRQTQTPHAWRTFELPLACIRREKLAHPWFGSSYVRGLVAPVPGRGLVSWGDFKILLHKRDADRFWEPLVRFLTILRETGVPAAVASRPEGERQAFIDPSDPTRIFVRVPAEAANAAHAQATAESRPYLLAADAPTGPPPRPR